MTSRSSGVVVTGCIDLDANVAFFVDELGFRVHLVTPADDPRRVVVECGGVRLALMRSDVDEPITLEIDGTDQRSSLTMTSPNGTSVVFVRPLVDVTVPASHPSLVVTDPGDGAFGIGRAGMEYRDLLPDRWGGRFIASHIKIDDGGDVADWVHFHRIRFQMIFVAAGWVEVVYEDQGPPFRMEAGDCVLQPPEIRHRVLRSSPGLEVIEIGCPAEHDTIADHDLTLPTDVVRSGRDFGGQRFVRHIASSAKRTPWIVDGLTVRDTGIGDATAGLAGAVVLSSTGSVGAEHVTNDGEFVMIIGLSGGASIDIIGHGSETIAARSSVALPPGSEWAWTGTSTDHEFLLISLGPDAVQRV